MYPPYNPAAMPGAAPSTALGPAGSTYMPAAQQLSLPGWTKVDTWVGAQPLPPRVQVDTADFLGLNIFGQRLAPGWVSGHFQDWADQLRSKMLAQGQSQLYAAALFSQTTTYQFLGITLFQVMRFRLVTVHTFGPLAALFLVILGALSLLALNFYTSHPDQNPISGPGSIGNQLCQIFGLSCGIQAATNLLGVYLLGGSALAVATWLVIRQLGGKQAAPELPKPPKLKAGFGVKAGPIHGDVEGGG